jgi:octaprenyl-diphosphate synthase
MASMLELPEELQPLQGLLERSLLRVEERFDGQLRSDLPTVGRLCRHVEQYRGKMLRPTLVILSGMAAAAVDAECGADAIDEGVVTEAHITVAAVCEMIHMATLVHDDVLDEADTRRRGSTVNRLHGNECAVILGDYLFSAAYHLCSSLPGETGRRTALLIGQTGMTLCAGELLQLHHREDYSIDEATYFEIVERKTASLIAAACRLGALHAGTREGDGGEPGAAGLECFGLKLGIAFQIQDDLLDLVGNQSVVGKPVGKDVELGKLTLPLIHHLVSAPALQRGRTLDLLSRSPGTDDQARRLLVGALEETRSIEHARRCARALIDEAKGALSALQESGAKRLLLAMADAVIDRPF